LLGVSCGTAYLYGGSILSKNSFKATYLWMEARISARPKTTKTKTKKTLKSLHGD